MDISKKIVPQSGYYKKLPALRDREFKYQSVKSLRFSKCLILKATHRVSVRPAVADHAGTAAAEEQASGVRTSNST